MRVDIYHRYELTIEVQYSVDESEYRGQNNFVTHNTTSTKILTGNEFMLWIRAILEDNELDLISFNQDSIYLSYMNPSTGESGETHVHVKELPFFDN